MGLKGKARQRANKKKRNRAINLKFLRNKSLRNNIRKWDDPILYTVCENVSENENVVSIIREMKSTLIATKNGVGLAAPQIGYAKNIIAIRSNRVTNDISIFINPVITHFGEKREMGIEGCLSYPELYFEVERSLEIKMEYLDESFNVHNIDFSGSDARIAQHECEHLSGKCRIGEIWRGVKSQQSLENVVNNNPNETPIADVSFIPDHEHIKNYRLEDADSNPDGIDIVPLKGIDTSFTDPVS